MTLLQLDRLRHMKKIAIFGGTFNPVHKGHINLCLQCNYIFNFDKILLIPTNIPPHKECETQLASNFDRLNMLKIAILENPLFEVSDIEYQLGGKSYTYNTIIELKKKYTDYEMYLIIGSDMMKTFHLWYNNDLILKEVTIIAGARHENEYNELLLLKEKQFNSSNKIQIADINIAEMSSTQIRQAIRDGLDMSKYLFEDEMKYIKAKKLYT